MDVKEAYEMLQSTDAHSRLKAARFLESNAEVKDFDRISAAWAHEEVFRIKKVLSRALDRLKELSTSQLLDDPEPIELADEIYSRSLVETTRMLLHELRPIIGPLIQRAKTEIPDYDSSQTARQITRLTSLLDGFDRLAKAASAAKYEDFDLADLIRDVSKIVRPDNGLITVEQIGPEPLIVSGDPTLAYMVISNGMRNAFEASVTVQQNGDPSSRIIVTWGETDVDYWVSIADRGPGLPIGSNQIWEIGTTNKKDHLGMGLAIAKQAAKSLQGIITLNPRAEGGVAFEFRWRKRRPSNPDETLDN